MHGCQGDGLCAWHRATQDKYRRAYHQTIIHAYSEAELEVIFAHTNAWMTEGGPVAGTLDDQPVDVLNWAAVAGAKYEESARAYVFLLYHTN